MGHPLSAADRSAIALRNVQVSSVLPACTMPQPCPVRSRRSHVQRRPDRLELRFRRRQRDVDGTERRAGRGRHRVCRQLLGGEFSHQFGHRRHRQDHRSRCRRRRQRPVRRRPGLPAARHRSAGHRVRRQTTLAYAENRSEIGGTLTLTDGRDATSIALLGNYMAGNFVADGHGGTLVTEAQTGPPPLLSHPRA
jgi:hypothetical protein